MRRTDIDAEVIVVGLGVAGASVLWRLARRGVAVVGVEKHADQLAYNASGGGARLIRSTAFEHPELGPFISQARDLWDELDGLLPERLQHQTGLVVIGPARSVMLRNAELAASSTGLEAHLLSAGEAVQHAAHHRLRPGDAVFFEPGATVVPAARAVKGMCGLATALGCSVMTASVTAIEPNADHAIVVAGGHRIKARRVVLATGAWLAQLIPGLPVYLARSVMHWFDAEPRSWPGETGSAFIRNIGTDAEPVMFGGMPEPGIPGRMKVMAMAGQSFSSADSMDRTVARHETDDVETYVAGQMRRLEPQSRESRACAMTSSVDGHFIVGTPPGAPRSLILVGALGGTGFKFAPLLGDLVADLIRTGLTVPPVRLFAAARLIPRS